MRAVFLSSFLPSPLLPLSKCAKPILLLHVRRRPPCCCDISTPAIQTAGSIVPDFWAESGLNFNLEFFSFCLKAFSRIIFPFFLQFQVAKMQTKRIYLNFLFKLLFLNSKFALTLGYLNPALNNPVPRLEESCLFKRERAYIVICLLAPRNEIQDGLGFWLPHHRFQIPGTRFRILCHKRKRVEQWNLDSGSSIPENSPGRDSGSHEQKFSKTLELELFRK